MYVGRGSGERGVLFFEYCREAFPLLVMQPKFNVMLFFGVEDWDTLYRAFSLHVTCSRLSFYSPHSPSRPSGPSRPSRPPCRQHPTRELSGYAFWFEGEEDRAGAGGLKYAG